MLYLLVVAWINDSGVPSGDALSVSNRKLCRCVVNTVLHYMHREVAVYAVSVRW